MLSKLVNPIMGVLESCCLDYYLHIGYDKNDDSGNCYDDNDEDDYDADIGDDDDDGDKNSSTISNNINDNNDIF